MPDRKTVKVKKPKYSILAAAALAMGTTANASLSDDAATAITSMVTEVGGVGTAIILLAAAIGTISVVKGLVRRH